MVALYAITDVALVTSLRDGMNLGGWQRGVLGVLGVVRQGWEAEALWQSSEAVSEVWNLMRVLRDEPTVPDD